MLRDLPAEYYNIGKTGMGEPGRLTFNIVYLSVICCLVMKGFVVLGSILTPDSAFLYPEEGEERSMIDPHSYNSARFADLRRVLTGWLNDELAQYRIIVKSLEEDLYDGHVLQKLTGTAFEGAGEGLGNQEGEVFVWDPTTAAFGSKGGRWIPNGRRPPRGWWLPNDGRLTGAASAATSAQTPDRARLMELLERLGHL